VNLPKRFLGEEWGKKYSIVIQESPSPIWRLRHTLPGARKGRLRQDGLFYSVLGQMDQAKEPAHGRVRLVLIGAGHAHLEVIRRLIRLTPSSSWAGTNGSFEPEGPGTGCSDDAATIMKTDSLEGQPILAPGELGTQNLLESEDHLGVVSQIEDDYPSLLKKMWCGGPIDDLTVDGGTVRRDGARHSGGGVGADELQDQNVIVEDREVSNGNGKKETTSSLPTSTGTPVANKTSARSARSKVVSVGAAKLEVLLSHPGEATTATRRKLTKMIGRLIAVTSMFIILQAAIWT